ncbi:MAG: hypothetical protein E6G01_01795 [Actinobacteria bacterium]|nr:MAG: hypothetical protein E6G01_01795 [Actinomycetota bacterium]
MTRVVAFVPDLMDRSRLMGTPGLELADRLEDLQAAATGAQLVLIDLSRPGALEVVPSLAPTPVIGFASHVDRDLLAAARRAGCARAVPRSTVLARRDGLERLLDDQSEDGPA